MGAAEAVCAAIEVLPATVPAAMTHEIEELLLATARQEGGRAVTRRAMEITYRFAPEVLEEQEASRAGGSIADIDHPPDGTVSLRGLLDKEAGALARLCSVPSLRQPRRRRHARSSRHGSPLRRRVHPVMPVGDPGAAAGARGTTKRRDHHGLGELEAKAAG